MTAGEGRVPSGATPDDDGTRFAAFSSVAERIEVCLFDDADREVDRVVLGERDGHLHHGHVPGVRRGQRYGYRATGPFDPGAGHRCDPAKLLVDPAARRVEGDLVWCADLAARGVDSAPHVPRSVVVAPLPPVDPAGRPGTARDRTVIYEAHVHGLTARHPIIPAEARGTYAALGHRAIVDHLLTMGVTTVELLPVHHFVSEQRVVEAGHRNLWGYNPLAWGAPHAGYATEGGDPVAELRAATDALHGAGIAVWLDVVFNHTAEGGTLGPTLSWRGLDAAAWYRLMPGADGGPLVDDDTTGCGNAVDLRHDEPRRLVRELLVRWATEYGIDGFRFDLATTLFRGADGPDPHAPLFAELADDPALAGVAWVAEPWDVGPGGYRLGWYPPGWSEWNDRSRDDTRDLWRGAPGSLARWATRLTGSADAFGADGRDPTASINFVSVHDGFTVADVVAYDHKHNEPNGEGNADGTDDNRSWNGGIEGPTDDPAVLANRSARQRALLGSLLCSQGVPMLQAGDELARTQRGNNNGYVLDPMDAAIDWDGADLDLAAWVASAVALRHAHPALRRTDWLDGEPDHQGLLPDVAWRHPAGHPMTPDDWHDPHQHALLVVLDGAAVDDGVLALAVNAQADPARVALPEGRWRPVLDSALARPRPAADRPDAEDAYDLPPWAFVVLERVERTIPTAAPPP